MTTPLSRLTSLCAALESERGKKRKAEMLGAFLKSLEPEEIKPAILILLAQVLPKSERGTFDVGYSTVMKAISSGQQSLLGAEDATILQAYDVFQRIARAEGPGSRRTKENLLAGLLRPLSEQEREYLLRSLFGEMRIGVNEGVMLDALASASGTSLDEVRKAQMLAGDLPEVARRLLTQGPSGLEGIEASVFTPIKSMLADTSQDVAEALSILGRAAFEYKLDGARIQIHKRKEEVRIFSRRLSDVTESIPEIASQVRSTIKADSCILEGEVIAFKGRPMPFQDVMRRFTRVKEVESSASEVPLRLYLFDILYLEGDALIAMPYEDRWEALVSVAPSEVIVPRIVTDSKEEAEAFLEKALAEGHEGLMAKDLRGDYSVGRRGKKWLKVKRAVSLDLVILAADWGYGRRTGWLSDYYLGARTKSGYEVVGKTFKGLTDEEFKAMTERLLGLKTGETRHTVQVRPEVVVEVAFDEVQKSPNYRSGFALRFARIKAVRDDKRPEEADTLATVASIYERQFERKHRDLPGPEPGTVI
ncbi:MAG TPA: ATP-dependent DNA ligase [Methanomassiliicoccales archaeon]|nr:ATP-dependent DNA ligase [Methanomassiliicoccales archaeon]